MPILAQPPHINSHRLLVIHTLCGYNNGAQHSDVTTAGIPRRPRSAPPPPRAFSATLFQGDFLMRGVRAFCLFKYVAC